MVLGLSGLLTNSTDARELGCSREHWIFSVVTDLSRLWPEYAGNKTVLRCEIGHADLLPGGLAVPEGGLVTSVKRDVDRLFPEAKALRVEWSRSYRERRHHYVSWHRGEFVKKPQPAERLIADRIFLAGDWTSRGTIGMEAAANSGLEAANRLLAAAGKESIPFRDVPLQ